MVVTDTANIEQAVTDTNNDTSVVMKTTELLTPTTQTPAGSSALPLTPTSALTPTFFIPTGDLVNIRTSPTTRARALGRLQGPYTGDIMGRSVDGLWLQFYVPRAKRAGWIRSDVVQVKGYYEELPQTAEAAQAVSEAANQLPQILIPVGDVVNVRNGPGTNFNILGRLRSRQAAAIVGKNADGTWWQIRFGDTPAWVNANVVRTTGNAGSVPVTVQ